MDYAAFLSNAERGQLPLVLLIHGADLQLLDDATFAATRALLVDPSAAAFDREVFDARDADAETVVNAALTVPVLARARLVVVRHCQALTAKATEVIGRYAASPSPAACLLLLADEPLGVSRERKTPHWLLGALPPAAVIALGPRRPRELEAWVRQRAAAEGLEVSEEAARLLVQWVGEDSATLLGEVRKAALAGGSDNRSVGVTEVTAVVGEHRISGIFDLIRAIERREVGSALRILDRLLATEDPMPILAALGRDVRTAWTIRDWRAHGLAPEQIARRLGWPPRVVDARLAAAAAQSPEALAWKLERCWRAEHRVKSGGQERAEMAALVVELCSAR